MDSKGQSVGVVGGWSAMHEWGRALKACRFPLLMAVVGLLGAAASDAGEARLSWSAPTRRVDGTPLAASELAGYTAHWGPATRNYTGEMLIEGGDVLTYTVTDLPVGTWYFAVRARSTDGLQSAYSAEVSKTIEASPEPLPPIAPDLTVAGPSGESRPAYVINQAEGTLALVPVGLVPVGTPCDSTQAVRDWNGVTAFLVPESAVTWLGTVRRSVVLAECE